MSNATFGKFGKGLSSLIGEQKTSENPDNFIKISPSKLSPSPYQPRTEFDPESLRELADSIEKNGIIQPIVARQRAKNDYEIIAGERRWRAAKLLNLDEVPVIIRNLTDRDCMEMALVENIQRRDLSPLEEAQAYRRLLGEFGYTQEDLAKTVGKSRSHVANILRLLALPDSIKQMIKAGTLSMGHARAVLSAENPDYIAQKIIEQKLSVRETEELIQDIQLAKEEQEQKLLEATQNLVFQANPAEFSQASPADLVILAESVIPQEAVAQAFAAPEQPTPTASQDFSGAASLLNTESPESNKSGSFIDRVEAIKQAEKAIERAMKNIGIDADDLGESFATTRFKDPDIIALEERLTRQLDCKIQIRIRGKRGEIRIKYRNLEQLDGIIQLLDGEEAAI